MTSPVAGTRVVRTPTPPRHCCFPPYVSSASEEAVDLCRMAGLELDPEQELVLRHSLGEKPDGRWAARTVGVCEPRQNGKGAIVEARQLTGLFLLGERLQTYSAHMFDTSLEAFGRLQQRIESVPDFDRRVLRVSNAHGKEGITLKGGQRVRFRTRTKTGGRGFSGEVVYLDEAMDLQELAIAALIPTMSAQSQTGNPQVWYLGSAVDQLSMEHGVVFSRVRARGLRGDDPELAWFEWSADHDDLDELARPPAPGQPDPLLDEEQWARANPALGVRISRDHVLWEFGEMSRRTFATERIGVGDWPRADGLADTVIDLARWGSLIDRQSTITTPPWFAIDVSPDRERAAIGTAGLRNDRLLHVEVVDSRPGTGWIVNRCVELKARHKPAGFVCDGVSPAASLVPELEQAGVKVEKLSADEHANAFGVICDRVVDGKLRHLGQQELENAIRGAVQRPLGERGAWSRRKSSQANITPLVAVTLAAGKAASSRQRRAYSW